jgi:predicted NAD/FAD-binding protein
MRIAIIGAGVSGLVAARLLSRRHDVTVYEAGEYAGGHTNTVHVDVAGERHAVDTGFIVFNHRTYPNFTRLLEQLGVESRETEMSFSVACDRTGLEYNGTSINTLFAQRRNLVSPGFHRMVLDILRFNREGGEQAARMNGASVGEFLSTHGYGERFRAHYLVPMGAAIWSCPPQTFIDFPVRFVMDFFHNHGMLQVSGRPVWRVIRGGSARYVERLTTPFADRIRLRTPVAGVRRRAGGVDVRAGGRVEPFDEVVMAVHADQALEILEDAGPDERRLLRAFPYQPNEAVLHTDTRVLPRRRRAWAAWNYRLPAQTVQDVTVTYNMNILQRLESRQVFCVSLNSSAGVAPERVLRRFTYHHPIYTSSRELAQKAHHAAIRRHGTSFCGAYWGYGFHEDGVNSALAVARAFGEDL